MRIFTCLLWVSAIGCYAPDILDRGFACKLGDPIGCPEGFACTACDTANNPNGFNGCCTNRPALSAEVDAIMALRSEDRLGGGDGGAQDATSGEDACATLCGMSCVDITSDVQHCGSCDIDCRVGKPTGATARCKSGACAYDCGVDRVYCLGTCLGSDADHCGEGCVQCIPIPHAVTWCASGACVQQCSQGYVLMGGTCVPE